MTDSDGTISPVAFLGLGKMGLPMASRLVAAGVSVTGYDPVEAARTAFAAAGGRAATSPAEAAAGASVLITMLPDGKAVRTALLGPEGVAGGLAPGGPRPRHEFVRAGRDARSGRGSRRPRHHPRRRSGLGRGEAGGLRIPRHHGRRRCLGRGAGAAAPRSPGYVDLRDRRDRLGRRDEGAEQLRLGRLRGASGRRRLRPRSGADDRHPQRLDRAQQCDRGQAGSPS